MRKTTIATILYLLGLIFGAIVMGLWDAETTLIKAAIGLIWTVIFLIALFYADKNEKR
jgi:hypothetical protein